MNDKPAWLTQAPVAVCEKHGHAYYQTTGFFGIEPTAAPVTVQSGTKPSLGEPVEEGEYFCPVG
jgi:hypothetical protein